MTVAELLIQYGRTLALTLAADLGCGAADTTRVLAAAEAAHAAWLASLSADSRARLEQEI